MASWVVRFITSKALGYPNMKLRNQPLNYLKFILFTLVFLLLTSCSYLEGLWSGLQLGGGEGGDEEVATENLPNLVFAAPKQLPYVPWFLANEEEQFGNYSSIYHVNIEFQSGDYKQLIEQFISGNIHAIAITNIDAVINLIPRNVEADVILVSSFSNGNDAILVPKGKEGITLEGKNIALMEYSVSHYLLDRYLLKQQMSFDSVKKENTNEENIVAAYENAGNHGVVTWNPIAHELYKNKEGQVIFSSRSIPKEINHLLVVRRDALQEHPGLANALLAIWINIMERMQGNMRGATLEAMANILGVDRDLFEEELESIALTDTQVKALSTIRDRSMRKTMRHIRYFMQRHNLGGDEVVSSWVSYPGRPPALLHYNAKMLQTFTAGPENQ